MTVLGGYGGTSVEELGGLASFSFRRFDHSASQVGGCGSCVKHYVYLSSSSLGWLATVIVLWLYRFIDVVWIEVCGLRDADGQIRWIVDGEWRTVDSTVS